MTQRRIAEETYLPTRTIKYALRILREEGLLQEKHDLDDLRRKYYRYWGKSCPNDIAYKVASRNPS